MEFVHDIQLVDGVYFLSSIVPYDTVVSSLNAVTPASTYTVPAEGQTGAEAAESAGVSFADLQALNPDLEDAGDDLTPGVTLNISRPGSSQLQVKVIERQTYQEAVPYDTVETESDQYDFGDRVVIQQGEDGLQEIVQDVTYVDGAVADINIVQINPIKDAVTEQVAVGTRLASGNDCPYRQRNLLLAGPQLPLCQPLDEFRPQGCRHRGPLRNAHHRSGQRRGGDRGLAQRIPRGTATMWSSTTATAGRPCTDTCPPLRSPAARRWRPARSSAMWATPGIPSATTAISRCTITVPWSAPGSSSRICDRFARCG